MTLIDQIAPTDDGSDAKEIEIHRGAEGILSWLLRDPGDDIRIFVHPHGHVVLEGTVEHAHQRRIVERRILGLPHVVSVDNRIDVPAAPYPDDLREQLLAAMRSDEMINATRIYVSIVGALVRLEGAVASPEQRALAGRVVLRHPAVHEVRNDLRIVRSHL